MGADSPISHPKTDHHHAAPWDLPAPDQSERSRRKIVEQSGGIPSRDSCIKGNYYLAITNHRDQRRGIVTQPTPPIDEQLAAMPFPLRNSKEIFSLDPVDMANEIDSVFSKGNHGNQPTVKHPYADFAFANLSGMTMVASRLTPSIIIEEEPSDCSTLAACIAGDVHTYRDGSHLQHINPGDIFLNPRNGGRADTGYISGLYCQIEHKKLQRTIRVLSGIEIDQELENPWLFGSGSHAERKASAGPFLALFSYIDNLLGESSHLPEALGLSEQIYRLLALALMQQTGSLELYQRRSASAISQWSAKLDDLVNYIQANTHLNLTLTDLEEHSHYSARHLQNLFREKFECTPMQFVRKQRLNKAMEELQTAGEDDTITSISRAYGYRSSSNFTTEFRRQFGVNPSTVLRASRAGGGGAESKSDEF